jgi:hypothetical protein
MSLGSVGIILGFLVAVVLAASLIARTASGDAEHRVRLRAGLLDQIRGLRLHQMLRYRGVDFLRYLYGERIVDIKTNISNCRRCRNLEQCDRVLADDSRSAEDFSFCPNCEHLARMAAEALQGVPESERVERAYPG